MDKDKKELDKEIVNEEQELDEVDTVVDEPWDHQFEEDKEPATRSAKNHSGPEASLYTKIIFGVVILLGVVFIAWLVGREIKWFSSATETTTTPSSQVARLVVQTTTTSTASDESSTTAASSSANSSTESSVTTSTTAATTTAATTTTAGPSGSSYTVKAGDTLYSIARNNNLSLSQLLSLNGLSQNSLIKPGDVLRLK